MASTNFVGGTVYTSAWGNDVDAAVYGIARPAWETRSLLRAYDAVVDAGCDNTGATNTTTQLKAFYDYCIANEVPGYIPAGTYKVTTGVLKWDNGFVATPFPYIETAGTESVTFVVDSATATNEPIFSWTNGVATGNSGQYWRDGYHGGFTLQDNTAAVATSRHGLFLRGLWSVRFGAIRGTSIRGDLVHSPLALHNVTTHANNVPTLGLTDAGATNPDPYALTFITFEKLENNFGAGATLRNLNFVGLNFCLFKTVRAVLTSGDAVFYGTGAANTVEWMSVSSCAGWTIDDGCFSGATGGTPEFFRLNTGELDDPEKVLRVNKMQHYSVNARIIHRMDGWGTDSNPLNTSGGYWPRQVGDFCSSGASSPVTRYGNITFIHRIEAGGVKANLGTFINGNNSNNFVTTVIDNQIIDNALFGFANTDLFTGMNANSTNLIMRDRVPIWDSCVKNAFIAVGSGTTTAPAAAAWATSGSIMIFNGTEGYDFAGLHNTTTGAFTVPYTGLYKVTVQFAITAAVGVLLRAGVIKDTGGTYTLVGEKYHYKVNAGAEHISYTRLHYFTQGDLVYAAGACSAGATAVTAAFSHAADNFFCVEAL